MPCSLDLKNWNACYIRSDRRLEKFKQMKYAKPHGLDTKRTGIMTPM